MTRVIVLAVASLFGLPVASPTALAQAADYYDVEEVALPDSLFESYDNGRITIRIVRSVRDSTSRRLLEHAERLFPVARVFDSLDAARIQAIPDERVARFGIRRAEEMGVGPRWWSEPDGDRLLPYALTASAVAWHLGHYRALAVQPTRSDANGRLWPQASLDYTVGVSRVESNRTYVVRLKLRAGSQCGMLCGGGFEIERVITFDDAGSVLRVRGDGGAVRWIS